LYHLVSTFAKALNLLIIDSLSYNTHHFPCAGKLKVPDRLPDLFLASDSYDNLSKLPVDQLSIVVVFSHIQKYFLVLAGALKASFYSDSVITDQDATQNFIELLTLWQNFEHRTVPGAFTIVQ
jgi:hypothetical protein